jgi:hypothetical protein
MHNKSKLLKNLLVWIFAAFLQLSSAVYEFRAGVIMVEKSVLPFKMEMVGPAIDMAMEESERTLGIRFRKYVALYEDWCNDVFSAGAIADLKYQVCW